MSKRFTVLARRSAPRNVAIAFIPVEQAAEQAVLAGARCIDVMIAERKKARLHADVGADELVLVAEGIYHATQSYAALAKAHTKLIQIPAKNDMEETFGPICAPNTGALDEQGLDRQVA